MTRRKRRNHSSAFKAKVALSAQMTSVAAGLVGKRLMHQNLIAPNGLPSGARSGRV